MTEPIIQLQQQVIVMSITLPHLRSCYDYNAKSQQVLPEKRSCYPSVLAAFFVNVIVSFDILTVFVHTFLSTCRALCPSVELLGRHPLPIFAVRPALPLGTCHAGGKTTLHISLEE